MANEVGASNTLIGEISDFESMRPRLRHDVIFAESPEGVFIRHSDDGFVLKGKSAYRWVATLSPHLTGEYTLAELSEGLDVDQRKTVAGLVRTLLSRGFARDHQQSEAHDLPEGVTARFAAQINFIEHYVDRAHARFTRFRESNVVVLGGGETARAVALGLLRNGLRVVNHYAASAELHDELTACARELTERGAPAQVRSREELAGYDVIVAVVEDIGMAGLVRLIRKVRGDTVILPVTVVGGEAIIGPATRAGACPCWTCAMLRMSANLPAEVMSSLWQQIAVDGESAVAGRCQPMAARMIGNALAFDVFRLRTECLPAESESAVVVVDTETLTSTREPLLVHPACPVCRPLVTGSAVASNTTVGEEAEPAERDLSERYWRIIDPHVGVFAEFTDETLAQSPVKAARVRVGLDSVTREITAFDVRNLLAARNRAVRAAALWYADRFGSGKPISFDASAQADGSSATVSRLGTWSGVPAPADERLSWLPATSAVSGDRWYVPAAAVFSRFDDGLLFGPSNVGTGSGVDLTAAVEVGVLSALGHRSLRAAAAGSVVTDALAEHADDPEITMLRQAAGHLGHPALAYLLPAGDCAVSVLARTDEGDGSRPRWVVRTAWTAQEAVREALRDLVGVLQLADNGPVDLGAVIDPDFDPRTVRVGASGRGEPPDARARWRGHLAEAGLDALVVETTPPDLVRADAALQTVRVLLHEVGTGKGGAST